MPQSSFLPEMDNTSLFLGQKRSREWVEASYLEEGIGENQEAFFLGTSVGFRSLSIFFALVFCMCGLLFVRTGYLQAFEGTTLGTLAEKNRMRIVDVPAQRGIISDRNGITLAGNTPRFSLMITKGYLPKEQDALLHTIAQGTGVDFETIKKSIATASQYDPVSVIEDLDYNRAMQIRVQLKDVPGTEVAPVSTRSYVLNDTKSLSHVLGYTSSISEDQWRAHQDEYVRHAQTGAEGVEREYETILKGVSGEKEVEVDALGTAKRIAAEKPPIDGKNLTLGIDASLQHDIEIILKETLSEYHVSKGVVIVSKPQTGEILSLVSLPSFDANQFAQGISSKDYKTLIEDPDKPLFNRAVRGEYPAGSTIKPVVAAAALQEKIVDASTSFMSTGGIHFNTWFYPDWKAGGHGRTNVIKALAESVNTYFYIVGGGYESQRGLGVDLLGKYFKNFGIGTPTGIDIPNEKTGFIPTPQWRKDTNREHWYIGDTYHLSIGQGDLLVTPLQVHMFTNYFANGGRTYTPHLVTSIHDDNGNTDTIPPKIAYQNIVDENVMETVRQGMRAAVTDGSARRLSTLPMSSAAKTGTAQWSTQKAPHAWVTGWAPYENPEIAYTILIEEGEEGSKSGMAVAYRLLRRYFNLDAPVVKGTPPTSSVPLTTSPTPLVPKP